MRKAILIVTSTLLCLFTLISCDEEPKPKKPEINLKKGVADIVSGAAIYNYWDVRVDKPGPTVIFTIENLGTGELNLTSVPDKIVKSGADAAMFTINETATTSPISPGNNTTFNITFSPTSLGVKTATISIANDDSDENPYTFTVTGKGIEIGFDFNGDGYDDVIVGASTDDDGGADSGCAFIFFGSATPLASIDASAANVKLVGEDANDQFHIVSKAGDFNNDGFDDVIVGAWYDDDGGNESGCAFIFFGSATPPATIDASNADVKLIGGDTGDWFGWSVSAGDFNNDGFDDALVGAYGDNDGGADSGCAFIFFGSATPPATIDASNADVILIGEDADNRFGRDVSAGDFNKDGFDDVIVGATYDDDGGADSGCAFIFFGSATPPATVDASNADVKLIGEDALDYFGRNVSFGDFNNDGFEDAIVGAWYDDDGGVDSGCAFIFFGSATPPATIDASNADVKLIGGDTFDYFGSVSSADFNNDGFDDVIVGAGYDDDGGNESGCAFIFFGSATPLASIDASAADVKLIGGDAVDRFGQSVSSAGDFNDDGYDDVIVGAYGDDDGASGSGCAFIFFGSATPPPSIDATAADTKLIGGDSSDRFGLKVGE